MALRLGLDVTLAIVQTNTVGHTRAGGFHRLAFQPTFDGQVEAGRDHVLVYPNWNGSGERGLSSRQTTPPSAPASAMRSLREPGALGADRNQNQGAVAQPSTGEPC